MSFRIEIRIFIDEKDEDAVRVFTSLVELAEASGFLAGRPDELDIIRRLVDGRGVTHQQLRHMNEEEFCSSIVQAAKDNGFPRGDMRDVEMAMFATRVLLGEKMLFDKLVRTLFQDDVFDEEEHEEEEDK